MTTNGEEILEEHIGETFEDEEIHLDNKRFENCTFTNCKIFYGGSDVVIFNNNNATDTEIHFDGSARNTLEFLRIMYHRLGAYGKKYFEFYINHLKNNPPSH